MARVIAGKFYGKVGDLIYSNRNGINYVKQAPKKSLKPPSDKQLIQWKKFAMVMRLLTPLRSLLNESYLNNPKRSGFQNALKKNLTSSIIGEYPNLELDYPNVSLVLGSLEIPPAEMVYDSKSNELTLCYQCHQCPNAYLNDQLFALIYCPGLPQYWHPINTGPQRFEQIGSFKLPNQLIGHDFHVWLYFRSEMLDQFSDSLYMGKVSTSKSEPYENTK